MTTRDTGTMTERHSPSNEELLEALRNLADELGRSPTVREMRRHGEYGVTIYQRRFESWNDALAEAGLEINKAKNISAEMFIDDIRRVADTLGHTPTSVEYNEHGSYTWGGTGGANRYFLSWWHAVKSASLDTSRLQSPSRNHLVEVIQHLALELDRSPTGEDIERHTPYSESLYREVFGSIQQAQYTAGVHDDLSIFDGVSTSETESSDGGNE